MGDVDDDDVDVRAQQLRGALEVIAFGSDRGTDAKAAVGVPGCKRELALGHQILRGDESAQGPVGVEQRKLLDLLLPHRLFGLPGGRLAGVGNQSSAWSHPRGHGTALIGKSQIPSGQQPLHTSLFVDDHQRADPGVTHPCGCVGETRVRRNRVGITDDAVLLSLDDLDFADLGFDFTAAEATVDDAQPAFLCHGNCHRGARHSVHVRRDDRSLEAEPSREPRRQIDGRRVATLDDAVVRREEEVVERAAADE